MSNNPKTMVEYALSTQNPRITAVVVDLFRKGSVLASDIPFVNSEQMVMTGARFTGPVPSMTWTKVNDPDIPSLNSEPEQFTEQAYLVRNRVETDHVITRDKTSIHNTHAFDIEQVVNGIKYDFNDIFLNNHHGASGNKLAPVGIRARLDDPKFGMYSGNKINANGLDISAAADSDDWRALVELLSTILWQLGSDNGDGVVLYMNYQVIIRLSSLAAKFSGSGGLSVSTDQFGRSVTRFKNAVIKDIGLKNDQATPVITVTETAAGADSNSTFTSIYGVRYGANSLMGWQYGPIDVRPIDDNTGIFRRTLIEWVGGLICYSTRSIARAYNIKFS